MDKETLNHFGAMLQKEKARFETEIKELEETKDFGSDVDHFEEEADEAEELSNRLPDIAMSKERLEDVKSALQKIENGTYGVCEKCGKEIEREVLEASPESALCKSCKNKEK